jgi:hypothetical protein
MRVRDISADYADKRDKCAVLMLSNERKQFNHEGTKSTKKNGCSHPRVREGTIHDFIDAFFVNPFVCFVP